MRKGFPTIPWFLPILLAASLTACAPQAVATNSVSTTPSSFPTPIPPSEELTYNDPFAYCASVGTIDTPDDRYAGPEISDEVINGFLVAAGLENSTEPMDMLRQTTIWRCMNGKVYACNFGASLPCDSKANQDTLPSSEMIAFCQTNPDSEMIPMSVTGHETVYSWRCTAGAPEVLEQIGEIDDAGYLANIWYPIEPGAQPINIATGSPTKTSAPAEPGVPGRTSLGGSSQILFASKRGGDYDDLYLLDLTTSQVTRLTEGDSNTFPGPFSPDGSQILFTGYGPLTSYVGLMAADGTNPLNLTQAEIDEGFASWSPDGAQIVFTSRQGGNNDIYVMNADGTDRKRLTDNPADDFDPAWSPDGARIAFVSDRDNAAGVNNLYVMDRDGSNVQRLTRGTVIDYSPDWSPGGEWIVFRAHHDGAADIYSIRSDGSQLVNLTDNPAEDWAPAWSPDGAILAFQTDRDGNWEIYVMRADGSDPVNLTQDPADDQMPYWAPAKGETALPNPASAHCVEQGGTLATEERGDLGQIGVCYFEDNRQCEEWALFRGECPVGGLKVTGYITEAARFCAITGGEYAITGNSGADDEQGTCTFPNGKVCDAWEYYGGACNPNE